MYRSSFKIRIQIRPKHQDPDPTGSTRIRIRNPDCIPCGVCLGKYNFSRRYWLELFIRNKQIFLICLGQLPPRFVSYLSENFNIQFTWIWVYKITYKIMVWGPILILYSYVACHTYQNLQMLFIAAKWERLLSPKSKKGFFHTQVMHE